MFESNSNLCSIISGVSPKELKAVFSSDLLGGVPEFSLVGWWAKIQALRLF